jgi:membrane-bound lytic murein transglycosylase B
MNRPLVVLVSVSALCAAVVLAAPATGPARASSPATAVQALAEPSGQLPFGEWLEGLRLEALARGIRPEVVQSALTGVEPLEIVLERDRAQAEFTLSVDQYLQRRLTPQIVSRARGMAQQHRSLLHKVGSHYGVQPAVLVSIWGMESNFGRFSGVNPTIPALATLAWDPRRSTFFRGQLLDALEILNRGDIELAHMKGSWAGAMGQPQFMPSAYLLYAEDFDGDGRRDIWTSLPDIFASIANYLKHHGWTEGRRWGREVRAPAAAAQLASASTRQAGCRALRTMSEPLPLSRWRQLGVTLPAGGPLPVADFDGSLFVAGKRTYLGYANYEAILAYNCAHTYALSVALLSDRIAGF